MKGGKAVSSTGKPIMSSLDSGSASEVSLSNWSRDELEAHVRLLEGEVRHKHTVACHVHLRSVVLDSDFSFLAKQFPHLEVVQMSLCRASEPAMVAMAKLPRLRQLLIEDGSQLGIDGLQHIGCMLSLETLRISHCGLGCAGSCALATALPQLSEQLSSLDLSHSSIGVVGASGLASSLPKLAALKRLNVRHNDLGDEGSMSLASALVSMSLQVLDISCNKIGPRGAVAVIESLQHHHELLELDLSSNPIHDAGGNALGTILLTETPKLRRLDLSFARIGSSGTAAVASGLKSCPDMLELQLACCSMGPSGAAALSKALALMPSLQVIGLSENLIEAAGAQSIAVVALPHLRSLRCLDLGRNAIGDEGVAFIANAFDSLPSLRIVNLTSNSIGDDGAIALARTIGALSVLEELYIGDNYVISESALSLAPALQSLSVLRTLDVYRNWVGDAGMKALLDALPVSVNKLDVSDNRCSAEGTEHLATLASSRPIIIKCDELEHRSEIEAASPPRNRCV